MLPESVLNEDEQLQMIYDTAITRTGGAEAGLSARYEMATLYEVLLVICPNIG